MIYNYHIRIFAKIISFFILLSISHGAIFYLLLVIVDSEFIIFFFNLWECGLISMMVLNSSGASYFFDGLLQHRKTFTIPLQFSEGKKKKKA